MLFYLYGYTYIHPYIYMCVCMCVTNVIWWCWSYRDIDGCVYTYWGYRYFIYALCIRYMKNRNTLTCHLRIFRMAESLVNKQSEDKSSTISNYCWVVYTHYPYTHTLTRMYVLHTVRMIFPLSLSVCAYAKQLWHK